MQGNPLFYPEYGKTVRKLYRTNPSIPRPESRHGSRSNMYDRVINYKREQLLLSMNEVTTASNAISNQLTVAATAAAATNRRRLAMLDVWQPEDVHLISDILNIENESLNEVLNVQSLKADFGDEADNMIVDLQKQYFKYETNTHITPMGRPVNTHPHRRWRSMWYSSLDEPNNAHLYENILLSSYTLFKSVADDFCSWCCFQNTEHIRLFARQQLQLWQVSFGHSIYILFYFIALFYSVLFCNKSKPSFISTDAGYQPSTVSVVY